MFGQIITPLRNAAGGLLDAALPQTCAACGIWVPAGTPAVCPACDAALTRAWLRPYCPRCGRTLPTAAIHGHRCARCEHERYWNLAGVARVGLYDRPLRQLLVRLKYHGHERNATPLADRLAQAMRGSGWLRDLDALVPVPMHWLRRLQRPCNHARVLSEALSRRTGVPTRALVRRVKYGRSQIGIETHAARFENVRGCFAPARWGAGLVHGRTVCIVDNLMKSGATVTEVAKALRRAGAKRIYAAVAARPRSSNDPWSRAQNVEPVEAVALQAGVSAHSAP